MTSDNSWIIHKHINSVYFEDRWQTLKSFISASKLLIASHILKNKAFLIYGEESSLYPLSTEIYECLMSIENLELFLDKEQHQNDDYLGCLEMMEYIQPLSLLEKKNYTELASRINSVLVKEEI